MNLKHIIAGVVFAVASTFAVSAETPWKAVASSPDHSVIVVLSRTQCSGKVASMIIDPALLAQAKTATVSVKGKVLKACWVKVEDQVAILMETGGQGTLPVTEFSNAEEI